MSDTITDMPKVAQLLDNGWLVKVFKNRLGSYTAIAARGPLQNVTTDDFTPEQALTRLAYKVLGDII